MIIVLQELLNETKNLVSEKGFIYGQDETILKKAKITIHKKYKTLIYSMQLIQQFDYFKL